MDDLRQLRRDFIARFTGGDIAVGPPAYCHDDVVAYTPEQAQLIFKNVMEAEFDGKKIPFLISGGARCAARSSQMMRHMLYHQDIDGDAVGVAMVHYHNSEAHNIADYDKRIAGKLHNKSPDNQGFVSRNMEFHVAPTIRVIQNNKLSDYVIDPNICTRAVSLQVWKDAQHESVGKEKWSGTRIPRTYQLPRLSLYHAMLDTSLNKGQNIKQEKSISGKRNTLDMYEMFSRAQAKKIHTKHDVQERQETNLIIGDAETHATYLATDLTLQNEMMQALAGQGHTLPNCGPLALKMLGRKDKPLSPASEELLRLLAARELESPARRR